MQNYQVKLKAGTQVVVEMVERIEGSIVGASVEAEPLIGGITQANAVTVPNGPANADRKWELSAGKWYKINGVTQQIENGKRWVAWWDHVSSTIKLKDLADYPKGANGQGLLFPWDPNYTDPDTSERGYRLNAQVRDANGITYVSLKNVNKSPLSTKEDWGIAFNGAVNIGSNEEFLYAIVDTNDIILWGKRRDGTTYDCDFSSTQYTDEQVGVLRGQIAVLKSEIDNVTANVSALKTDYEALKSDYNTKFSIVTNEEFLYAVIDLNNIILWGKRRDGTTYDCDNEIIDSIKILQNDVSLIKEGFSLVSNEEYLYALVDYNNVILWGK
ncbi:hypothetical protein ACR79K_25980, partial [Sphingobacterium siyangense]